MQSEMALWYAIWILVPLLPAILLFKVIPGDASGSGTLFGMKWKLGGAFAGYAFVLLASYTCFIADMKNAALADLGESWIISGHIKKADGSVPLEAKFLTQPPILDIRDDGSFSVSVLLPRRKPGETLPPDLVIKCENFNTVGITLPWDEASKSQLAPAKYTATRNPTTHAITIDPPIVLDPLPPNDPKQ